MTETVGFAKQQVKIVRLDLHKDMADLNEWLSNHPNWYVANWKVEDGYAVYLLQREIA